MGYLALRGGSRAVTKKSRSDPLRQKMIKEEIRAVSDLIRKNQTSISPVVKELEDKWAAFIGVKYCLAQNNGTSALHAAYFAAGIGPGDEVIAPVLTWHLGVTPILASHGIPVFCDCDGLTLNITPSKIEAKITRQTRAIVVTHLYGHPVDMDPVLAIARKHKLAVIEDASHAHGATYKGKKTGALGDMACFSLQGSKLMAGGEAGLFVTNDRRFYERAIMLGHYERIPALKLREFQRYKSSGNVPPMNLGFKYRIHPFAAAMALVQLKYLEHRNSLQRRNLEYLAEGLSDMDGFDPAYVAPYATQVNWLNYLARFYPGWFKDIPRDRVIEALRAEGVPADTGRAGYIPLHLQPLIHEQDMYGKGCPWKCRYAKRQKAYRAGDFPVAERVHKERIMLPTFRDTIFDSELLDQYITAFRKVAEHQSELR